MTGEEGERDDSAEGLNSDEVPMQWNEAHLTTVDTGLDASLVPLSGSPHAPASFCPTTTNQTGHTGAYLAPLVQHLVSTA